MKHTSVVSLKEKPKNINKIENIAWILAGFLRERVRELELQWRHDKALDKIISRQDVYNEEVNIFSTLLANFD